MNLSRLQRRILALLEEAGEEGVGTLANSVAEPTGDPTEITAMREAIRGLYDAELVELADSRDSVSLKLVGLGAYPTKNLLESLGDKFVWNRDQGLWKWREASDGPQVITTEPGHWLAMQIWSEERYPLIKLDGYW